MKGVQAVGVTESRGQDKMGNGSIGEGVMSMLFSGSTGVGVAIG
jgi:hypothetical protein